MRNILFLLLIFNFACKGQKGMDKLNEKSVDMKLELLLQDNYSGVKVAENRIIRNEKDLQKFFSKINRTRKPGIPRPIIDFSKTVLVIVCEGEHTEGNDLTLEVLKETEEEIELVTKENKEKSTSTAKVSPFKVYKLNNNSKKVVLKK